MDFWCSFRKIEKSNRFSEIKLHLSDNRFLQTFPTYQSWKFVGTLILIISLNWKIFWDARIFCGGRSFRKEIIHNFENIFVNVAITIKFFSSNRFSRKFMAFTKWWLRLPFQTARRPTVRRSQNGTPPPSTGVTPQQKTISFLHFTSIFQNFKSSTHSNSSLKAAAAGPQNERQISKKDTFS